MREIKFRAFQDNKMYTQERSGVYGTKKFLDTLYEDCDLMQYTGLKDKNGVQIFEGDVILAGASKIRVDHPEGYLHEIVYGQSGFWPRPIPKTAIGHGYILRRDHLVVMEVVGNIHENPELLA